MAIGLDIEKVVKPMKEAAQKAGRKKGGGDRKSEAAQNRSGGNSPKAIREPRTTDVAAASVGMDRRTYEKAKAVVASGDADRIAEMEKSGKAGIAFRHYRG